MRLPKIAQLIVHDATFSMYEAGNLWYVIIWNDVASDGSSAKAVFSFPVKIFDVDDAGGTFNTVERGITLMRWIRRHLEYLQLALAVDRES